MPAMTSRDSMSELTALSGNDPYWNGMPGAARISRSGAGIDFEEFFDVSGRCLVSLRDGINCHSEHHVYRGEDLVKFHIRLRGTSTISLDDAPASEVGGPLFGAMIQPSGCAKVEMWNALEHQRWITLVLDREAFADVFASALDVFPVPLRNLASKGAAEPFQLRGELRGDFSSAAAAMLESKLCGSMRRLYFESKTLELLLNIANYFNATTGKSAKKQNLTLRDREKIRELHDLLKSDSLPNISIDSLSTELAINRDKLMKGFKQMYGQTITETALYFKMHRSRSLLNQGQSVTQVALETGYAYVSNFSTAYRRFFGVSPKKDC
ncbi:helix-turn-helix transcriptional regulator [Paraburkholderia sp. D1E]|uniref:helix-turn-helix transcriptional regulator n=1 Tax=Paraburkholderia sp. D1E TaxID=3461398 RepID=UPI0040456374